MFKSTPESRAAKRDAIAARYADYRPIRWNPSAVAATTVVGLSVAVAYIESWTF